MQLYISVLAIQFTNVNFNFKSLRILAWAFSCCLRRAMMVLRLRAAMTPSNTKTGLVAWCGGIELCADYLPNSSFLESQNLKILNISQNINSWLRFLNNFKRWNNIFLIIRFNLTICMSVLHKIRPKKWKFDSFCFVLLLFISSKHQKQTGKYWVGKARPIFFSIQQKHNPSS